MKINPALLLRSLGTANNFSYFGTSFVIEIVDERENLEKLLPFLEKNVTDGLVLLEDSQYLVTDYTRKREAEKEALLAQQNKD